MGRASDRVKSRSRPRALDLLTVQCA